LNALSGEMLAVHLDTVLETGDERVVGKTVDLHVVGLLGSGRGVCHTRGPSRIVTEEQQPLAGFIQPPYRSQPG